MTRYPHNCCHPVIHFHAACLHPYNDANLDDLELNTEYYGQDNQSRWIMLIQHPRWCANCAAHRGRALHVRYEHRLRSLTESSGHEETVREELAFVRGVRDGRIAALTLSFSKIRELQRIEDAARSEDEGFGEMVEMMEDAEVGPREPGSIEQEEEVFEMFVQASLGAADELAELETCLKESQAYDSGLQEGNREQGEKEYRGCTEIDLDQKMEMLEMALA